MRPCVRCGYVVATMHQPDDSVEHHCRACQRIIYVELEEVSQQAMEEVAMQAGLASLRTMMDPKDPECPVRRFVAERQKRARSQAPPSRGSSSDVCPKCGLQVCDGLCQGPREDHEGDSAESPFDTEGLGGDQWQKKLESFFALRNPSKLTSVPALMLKYHGCFPKLWRELCAKYDCAGEDDVSGSRGEFDLAAAGARAPTSSPAIVVEPKHSIPKMSPFA